MNKNIILCLIFMLGTYYTYSQCGNEYLFENTWITSENKENEIIFDTKRKVLNSNDEYISNSWEIQMELMISGKVKVKYIEFDEFQEVIIPSFGQWKCKQNILEIEGVVIRGKNKFYIKNISNSRLVLEVKE